MWSGIIQLHCTQLAAESRRQRSLSTCMSFLKWYARDSNMTDCFIWHVCALSDNFQSTGVNPKSQFTYHAVSASFVLAVALDKWKVSLGEYFGGFMWLARLGHGGNMAIRGSTSDS
jgi:hypothetical protein